MRRRGWIGVTALALGVLSAGGSCWQKGRFTDISGTWVLTESSWMPPTPGNEDPHAGGPPPASATIILRLQTDQPKDPMSEYAIRGSVVVCPPADEFDGTYAIDPAGSVLRTGGLEWGQEEITIRARAEDGRMIEIRAQSNERDRARLFDSTIVFRDSPGLAVATAGLAAGDGAGSSPAERPLGGPEARHSFRRADETVRCQAPAS